MSISKKKLKEQQIQCNALENTESTYQICWKTITYANDTNSVICCRCTCVSETRQMREIDKNQVQGIKKRQLV